MRVLQKRTALAGALYCLPARGFVLHSGFGGRSFDGIGAVGAPSATAPGTSPCCASRPVSISMQSPLRPRGPWRAARRRLGRSSTVGWPFRRRAAELTAAGDAEDDEDYEPEEVEESEEFEEEGIDRCVVKHAVKDDCRGRSAAVSSCRVGDPDLQTVHACLNCGIVRCLCFVERCVQSSGQPNGVIMSIGCISVRW